MHLIHDAMRWCFVWLRSDVVVAQAAVGRPRAGPRYVRQPFYGHSCPVDRMPTPSVSRRDISGERIACLRVVQPCLLQSEHRLSSRDVLL